MMRLTAVDIESRRLKRAFRGYSIREVEDFRQEIIDNFEEMLIENAQLREQSAKLTVEVEHYRSIEKNLNQSLILAQRAADDVRASAHHEAEAILRDARNEAQEMLRQARQERAVLEKDFAELMDERDRFAAEFRALVQSCMSRLEPIIAQAETKLDPAAQNKKQPGPAAATPPLWLVSASDD